MAQTFDEHTHPLVRALIRAREAMRDLADLEPAFLTTEDKLLALDTTSQLAAMTAACEAKLIAGSEDLAGDAGSRSSADWVAREALDSRHHTSRAARLGEALTRWTRVRTALSVGAVNARQATVITHALDALPVAELDPELLHKAEAHLLTEAAHFGPRELKRIGDRLLEVIAPDIADEHLFKQLQDEERRGLAEARMKLRPRGDGTTDLFARLPDDTAHKLGNIIDAIANPRRATYVDPGQVPNAETGDLGRLPIHRRRGLALIALIDKIPGNWLPQHGAMPTTMIINMRLQDLLDQLGTATISSDQAISGGQARRLACQADLIPAVLGGKSEVLDLGRSSRLFTRAQRTAMAVNQPECAAVGCTIPAPWCDAHHKNTPWAHGGTTNLADGILLCTYHHQRAHDTDYRTEHLPTGDVRFHRRC